jgi:hypothetical protein
MHNSLIVLPFDAKCLSVETILKKYIYIYKCIRIKKECSMEFASPSLLSIRLSLQLTLDSDLVYGTVAHIICVT